MIKRQKVEIVPESIVKLPADARVIDFAPSRNTGIDSLAEYIDMWYDDPGESEGQTVAYVLKIRGTGQNSPKDALHLKTLVMGSGLVWHLYIWGQTNQG